MRIQVKYIPSGYRMWPNGSPLVNDWWTMDLCKHCGADSMLNAFCMSCYTAR